MIVDDLRGMFDFRSVKGRARARGNDRSRWATLWLNLRRRAVDSISKEDTEGRG
jgi:hypothetical protein